MKLPFAQSATGLARVAIGRAESAAHRVELSVSELQRRSTTVSANQERLLSLKAGYRWFVDESFGKQKDVPPIEPNDSCELLASSVSLPPGGNFALSIGMERTDMKPDDTKRRAERRTAIKRDDVDSTVVQWSTCDRRTQALASLVARGFKILTANVRYTAIQEPEQGRSILWFGFDSGPDFPRFQLWLHDWIQANQLVLRDVHINVTDLVNDAELRLNPDILFVH